MTQLAVLTATERACLDRYVAAVRERLGGELVGVWVFGSVARGERWPAGMPIRSDLDLLVVTRSRVGAELEQELLDATLPLFLECGRQIGPQFRTLEWLAAPPDERTAQFLAEVRRDAVALWRDPRADAPLPV